MIQGDFMKSKMNIFCMAVFCVLTSPTFASSDGILYCSSNDGKTNVKIEAKDGIGSGFVRSSMRPGMDNVQVGQEFLLQEIGTSSVIVRSRDQKNMIASVSKGGELIQISASELSKANCPDCNQGQSLSYRNATLSTTYFGILSIETGLNCTLELPRK
jgi:hypothetical protein